MELSLKTLSESEYLGTQQHNACSQIFSHQHREEEKNFFNLRVENWLISNTAILKNCDIAPPPKSHR